MNIRAATEDDIPAIVDLLKISLGEDLIPKSERYWRWKHLDNPFGQSPVLLCWDGELLIGVRAFMRWEWIHRGKVLKAARAVDTATHPDYQGKGIFRKLTLMLVDHCKEGGYNFIFNTPNPKSRAGYLKMGWEVAGKLPVQINLCRPFKIIANYFHRDNRDAVPHDRDNVLENHMAHPKFNELLEEFRLQQGEMITNITIPYLRWRYCDVPVASYFTVGDENGGNLTGILIGRIKDGRLGRELRITDCILKPGIDKKALRMKLKKVKQDWGIDYITLSGKAYLPATGIPPGPKIKFPNGPIVTVRSIITEDLQMLNGFSQWSPSLGDLELF